MQQHQNIGIALNITRSRITVLVFNLTIIALMLSILSAQGMSTNYNHLEHLSSSIALFTGFCLTILGIFWLLSSQDLDAQGLSRPLPFTLGSLTSYLALSQTITAFMHEYLLDVELTIAATQPVIATNLGSILLPAALGDSALLILFSMGSALWILTTYLGPIMMSFKSPIERNQRWLVALYYFAVQIPVYWVYAHAWNLQYVAADQPTNMLQLFALQFMQPVLWF